MRDLHCSEGACTLDPPKSTLKGGGIISESDMINVIPYNQVKISTKKKKRAAKKPLKGSGSKKSESSRKINTKQKGRKKSATKKKANKKHNTDLKILKALIKNIKKRK